MKAEQNERITRIGPGTPCGELMRRYWQPVALVDEFDPQLDARMALRPLKAVRLLGQDFILFQDDQQRWGLLDRDCPHRNADLAFARHEGDGVRCPFHGWKFDASGRCLDTPGEPEGSRLCDRVRQGAYPVLERSGVLFAWLGASNAAPPLPDFDCFAAPGTHTFAYKGLWHCNWLQAYEVGLDPVHTSFLHRFLGDAPLDAIGDNAAGKQFRSASAGDFGGERWPMTRVMREFHRPDIRFEPRPWGLQLTTLRPMTEALTHVRVTQGIFPHTFVIPLSETLTITQMHVPVDDTTPTGTRSSPASTNRWTSRPCASNGHSSFPARTSSPRQDATTTGASTPKNNAPPLFWAWAKKTSTCMTNGRWRAWAPSRIAPANTWAPPTR